MIKLDFTTVATCRPEILDKTYASFSKNLADIDLKNCNLFINVDPLPCDSNQDDVVKVAENYFKSVTVNCPDVANFSAACNWVWSNAQTDFIFHLEDDWELIGSVSIKTLLNYFEKHKKLLMVALRAYKYIYKACPLSPCVMHKRLYKTVAGKLRESSNPESQLRGKNFGIELPSVEFKVDPKGKLVIYPEGKDSIIIKDIGRKWIKKSNYNRPNKKGGFTSWVLKSPKKKNAKKIFSPIKIKKVIRKNDVITQLADKYGCDKGNSKHGYTNLYTNYFYTVRDKKFKMLEIGFGEGRSVKVWLDYFKNIKLYCVDIMKELPKGFEESIDADRFEFISADQSSVEDLSKIFCNNNEDFGIILDDGSHISEDEMLSFGYLFPHLCKGGVYIIEDLNCKRGHNKKFDVEEDKVINILKKFKDVGEFDSNILDEQQKQYAKKHIAGIEIYKDKIVFIYKK